MNGNDYAISCCGLTRRFGAVTAVDDLNLDVPRGRIFGFLGPNGSGKSTTMRLLCGLLAPSAGHATVLGCRVPEEAEKLRLRMGYMTQKFSLYQDLTVIENLRFVARAFSLGQRRMKERIAANSALYQLESLHSRLAGTLSGGQRQRLALAAVTLHEPQLLLLDEPTSAVDPQSRRDFWDRLFELAEQGATILVSTHFMDEAERCHRLTFLDRGAMVREGAPRDLMNRLEALTVEIDTEAPRRTRALLGTQDWVRAVTQLGNRLRVMLMPDMEEPAEKVRELLGEADLQAVVRRTPATLEDVFVAATGFGGSQRA